MGKILTALAICVVPLVVGLHADSGDLFSYWKAATVMSIAAVGLAFIHPHAALALCAAFISALILDSYPRPTLFETWATYIAYFIVFLLALRYARSWIMPFIALSATIIALVGLLQLAGIRPVLTFVQWACGGKITYIGVTSTLHNENYIGHYCSMVLPILVIYAAEKKAWYLLPSAALAASLIFAASWLGVLAAAVSFALYLCLPGRGIRPKICVFAALTVATCSFTLWKGPAGAVDLLANQASRISSEENGKFLHGRGYIWAGSIAATKLWPQGPGRLAETFRGDPLEEYKTFRKPVIVDRPHSLYLQIAHAFGWWGLLVYLVGTWALGFKSITLAIRPSERAFVTGCWVAVAGFHVAGLLNDGGPSVWPVYAVLFGAAVSGGWPRRLMV